MLKRCSFAAAGALLLVFAIPSDLSYEGAAPLGFICLVPYFFALGKTKSNREAAACGFVFGALSHAAASYWLVFFRDFAVWTIGLTTLLFAVYQIPVALLIRRLQLDASRRQPFLLAALWTLWEWAKSSGPLGYPWGLTAYSLTAHPQLLQIADITGVYGLSFMLALSSALCAEMAIAFPRPPPRNLMPALLALSVLFAGNLVYGAWKLKHPVPAAAEVSLLLVQPNLNHWIDGERQTLETALRLSRQGLSESPQKPDLIVWPESVLARPYLPGGFYRQFPPDSPLEAFFAAYQIPLLTGAPALTGNDGMSNAAVLIEDGKTVDYYAKQHLIPFAEYVPLQRYAWMRRLMLKIAGFDRGWMPGNTANVLEIALADGILRFGTPICFEDAFAPLCAAFFTQDGAPADMLINLTNDSWSKRVSAEYQHLAAARFRSIENRRTLVRATTAGITALINAEGIIIQSIPPFTEAYMPVRAAVQKSAGKTFYQMTGDWLPALCALFLILHYFFRKFTSAAAL